MIERISNEDLASLAVMDIVDGQLQDIALKVTPEDQREQGLWSWIVHGLYLGSQPYYGCTEEEARRRWHSHGRGVVGTIKFVERCVVTRISLDKGRINVEIETVD